MSNIPLIDLRAQYATIQEETEQQVLAVMRSGSYILGQQVKQFEQSMADYTACKYAISCGNGTDALILALQAVGVRPGDEVITSPYSFFATSEAIAQTGAIPIFADIEDTTYNMNPSLIESLITKKTKAIVPVHLFGLCADMDPILSIASRHGLKVVEDACQAVGATYKGRKAGSMGDAACFSFFPTKNLGAFGDAGMITTNSDEVATICRALRVHGGAKAGRDAWQLMNAQDNSHMPTMADVDETIYNKEKYYNYLIAYNSRMDEMQAAILNVKFRYLDEWNTARTRLAKQYDQALGSTNLVLPVAPDNYGHVFHLYIVQSDQRDELVEFLNSSGIATGTYYPVPLHLQKAHVSLGGKTGDCPVAEFMSHRTFAIPVYPELSETQQAHIIKTILSFPKHGK